MIRITINLATKRYPGKGAGIALPVAVILSSAVLSLYMFERVGDYADSIERMRKRVEDISARRPALQPKEAEELRIDPAVVSDIIEKRGFSWIEALDNLEKALPSGISLTSIQPSFKGGGARLSGYARDFAALSRFINNLEDLRVYKRVFLNNQSIREMEGGKEAIVFNISIEGGK